MADIVLTTLNARYAHTSFGLRYLMANLGGLQERAELLEFDIKQEPAAIAARILEAAPRIIGIGVYIWNTLPALAVIRELRARRPDIILILGGPEVSHEIDQQPICALADYIVTGEADLAFADLCGQILAGTPPPGRIIECPPADVRKLALPYPLYTDKDIATRVIYVEASRGCPFTCEFCLSSLELPLRRFPLEQLLPEFQRLLDRGVRNFKFVDRTFNLSIPYSLKLLEFFLERYEPGLFLHFEMIPDRLPGELREIIKAFPPGTMQFEVGVQTFNEEVAARIKRRQDYTRTIENIRFLREETGSYIHADLIYGLPGETLESIAAGFDKLVSLRPHEIQFNMLKRLRGTPIARHDSEWRMVYDAGPPYELKSSGTLTAEVITGLNRFAKYWDLVTNSGNFIETAPLLWRDGSAFAAMQELSAKLHARFERTYGIPLEELAEGLFDFLAHRSGIDAGRLADTLWRDLQRGARRDMPKFLRTHLDYEAHRADFRRPALRPKRQARHYTDPA